jgi:uncharacterized protein HemY
MTRLSYPPSRGRTSSMSVLVGIVIIVIIIFAVRAVIRFY